jgi:hypothetical protein
LAPLPEDGGMDPLTITDENWRVIGAIVIRLGMVS